MNKIVVLSAAAFLFSAAIPLSALAQTGSTWHSAHSSHHRGHGVANSIAVTAPNDFGYYGYGYGYGLYPYAFDRRYDHDFYLDAPGYPHAPPGGNSGGANFPHSGS